MYSSTVGCCQPAARAAASAMAHCEFCGTPCSVLSQRRTAFWSRGSMPLERTSSTHSSSVRPVRSRMDRVTAAIISSGLAMVASSEDIRASGILQCRRTDAEGGADGIPRAAAAPGVAAAARGPRVAYTAPMIVHLVDGTYELFRHFF